MAVPCSTPAIPDALMIIPETRRMGREAPVAFGALSSALLPLSQAGKSRLKEFATLSQSNRVYLALTSPREARDRTQASIPAGLRVTCWTTCVFRHWTGQSLSVPVLCDTATLSTDRGKDASVGITVA